MAPGRESRTDGPGGAVSAIGPASPQGPAAEIAELRARVQSLRRAAERGAADGGGAEIGAAEIGAAGICAAEIGAADDSGAADDLGAAHGTAERRAAEIADAGLRPTLDAVLGELELTIGLLGKLRSGPNADGPSADDAEWAGAADAERRLLRAVFQEVPAPIFLLERDFAVRRVNRQASDLLGAAAGSATGKPFTALVEPEASRAVREQLSAVLRTGRPRRIRCQLLSVTGKVDTTLTIDLVRRPGRSRPLIMAVAGLASMPQPVATADSFMTARSVTADRAIAETTQRLDLISAATRLLFENAAFGESLMLRRCASLFAAGLSAWVIVDVEKDGEMRRLFVAGPAGERFVDLTRAIEDQAPQPGSLPWEVHTSGRSRLITDAADVTVVGRLSSGVPVLTLLGATSVLCIPLTDGERSYGTLTLARRPEAGPFDAADLELVNEIGQQLAVAIKVGRMFLRRSAVTEALQASLLPRDLPPVPGVEIATAYVLSAQDRGVGGDFYDVYPGPSGWGLVIGDVCGRGEEAGAATALARYAIRVLAHWHHEPADVLRLANEVMSTQPGTDRFVTAVTARFGWQDEVLRVALASAGHPAPLLVRPDGRVRVLSGGGLPLGFFDDARPATEQLELEPGDMLFFYSDGVTEARDAGGGYFEATFADALAALAGRPAREVAAAIRELVLDFSGGDVRDDVTMVALRVLDPPARAPGRTPGGANQRDGPAHGPDQL